MSPCPTESSVMGQEPFFSTTMYQLPIQYGKLVPIEGSMHEKCRDGDVLYVSLLTCSTISIAFKTCVKDLKKVCLRVHSVRHLSDLMCSKQSLSWNNTLDRETKYRKKMKISPTF